MWLPFIRSLLRSVYAVVIGLFLLFGAFVCVMFLVDIYISMVTHIARVWINRVRLPVLHVVS